MSIDDFEEALEAFDREVIRNENGAREVLIEAGILVPINQRRPSRWTAEEADRLRAIHSPKETAP